MLGDQTKSLIIISKAKGWDPTVIPAREGQPAVDLSNWDKSPQSWETSDAGGEWAVRNRPIEVYGTPSVGNLPEGDQAIYPQNTESALSEKITFETPDALRENKDRSSSGADPFSGMGGM